MDINPFQKKRKLKFDQTAVPEIFTGKSLAIGGMGLLLKQLRKVSRYN